MAPGLSPTIDVAVGRVDDAQAPLPLASDGVLRWVWQSKFGDILIEVVGNDIFVDGKPVQRHAS